MPQKLRLWRFIAIKQFLSAAWKTLQRRPTCRCSHPGARLSGGLHLQKQTKVIFHLSLSHLILCWWFCSAPAEFLCAILDCPEWLGVPLKPGCHRKYDLDTCCSAGEICDGAPPPIRNVGFKLQFLIVFR